MGKKNGFMRLDSDKKVSPSQSPLRSWWWRLKHCGSGRKRPSFRVWFVDGFLFAILSFFEGVVLVGSLCFFYLCCGCNI